jgi:WD40 repeat protein
MVDPKVNHRTALYIIPVIISMVICIPCAFGQYYHLHRTMGGHTGWVLSVAFSPESDIIASGSADNTVKLWDITMGSCILTLRGHARDVYSVAFSSDGTKLASGSEDNTVKIWDVKQGSCVHTCEGHDAWVHAVAFSPDGKSVASGAGDNRCRIWDVDSGVCVDELTGHTGSIWTVAYSPDGEMLATGSSDNSIKLWDSKGELIHTLTGHKGAIRCLAFNPSGALLASGARDNTIIVWRVKTGEKAMVLEGHTGWVESIVYTPDGIQLISCSDDKTIRIWSAATGICNQVLGNHNREVLAIALNPSGTRLISGSCDNKINVWRQLRLHKYTNYYQIKIKDKIYQVVDVEYPGEPRAKAVIDEEGKPVKDREIIERVLNAGDVIGFYKEPEYKKERFKYFIGSEVQPRIGALKLFIDEIPGTDLVRWWRTEKYANNILAAAKSTFLIGSEMAREVKKDVPYGYAELAVEKFMRDPVMFFTALCQSVIVDGMHKLMWIESKCEELRDDEVIAIEEYDKVADAYWDAIVYAHTMDYIYNKMQAEITTELTKIVQNNRSELMKSLTPMSKTVSAATIGIKFGELIEQSKLYSTFHSEVKKRWELKQREAYEMWKKERVKRAIQIADKMSQGLQK